MHMPIERPVFGFVSAILLSERKQAVFGERFRGVVSNHFCRGACVPTAVPTAPADPEVCNLMATVWKIAFKHL